MYDDERAFSAEHGGAVWAPRASGFTTAGAGIHDPSTTGQYVDPLVGIMSALGRNPEAAQRFLSGGGTTTLEVDGVELEVGSRLTYLVVDRTWAAHGNPGDALGSALAAATTTFRVRDARGRTSAEIAGQTFALVGEQTGEGAEPWRGDQGRQMWAGMRVHVSQMLAS